MFGESWSVPSLRIVLHGGGERGGEDSFAFRAVSQFRLSTRVVARTRSRGGREGGTRAEPKSRLFCWQVPKRRIESPLPTYLLDAHLFTQCQNNNGKRSVKKREIHQVSKQKHEKYSPPP